MHKRDPELQEGTGDWQMGHWRASVHRHSKGAEAQSHMTQGRGLPAPRKHAVAELGERR